MPKYSGELVAQPTWKLDALYELADVHNWPTPKGKTSLAHAIGTYHGHITHYLENNRGLPSDLIQDICAAYQIPFELYVAPYKDVEDFKSAVRKHWFWNFEVRRIESDKELMAAYDIDEYGYDEKRGRESKKKPKKSEIKAPPENNITREQFRQWHRASGHDGFFCAFRGTQPFFGIGVFPVTREWAIPFLRDQYSETLLDTSTIREGASDLAYWYFSGLTSDDEIMRQYSGLDPGAFSFFASNLLGRCVLEWAKVWANRIGRSEVTVVVEGTTDRGRKMLNRIPDFCGPAGLADSDGHHEFDAIVTQTDRPRRQFNGTLWRVRTLLLEHPYFKFCKDLHAQAQDCFELNSLFSDEKR